MKSNGASLGFVSGLSLFTIIRYGYFFAINSGLVVKTVSLHECILLKKNKSYQKQKNN